jgi:hypothetical protein
MERTPFDKEDKLLINIDTGVTVKINVDNAVSNGMNSLKEMVGNAVDSYSFKKSQEVNAMDTKACI